MVKRTPTADVFDQLAVDDDPAQPVAKPDAADEDTETAAAHATEPDEESDDVVSEHDETEGDHPAAARPSGRRRLRIIGAVVGVLLIGFMGLSAFLGWREMQRDDTAAAGQAALQAARDYAVTLTTLDAKDIDSHYRQALGGATGEFKSQYGQGSAQLRQILIDNQAAGRGVVIDAAIKSATKTSVEVLLFVDQSITNAVNPSPRIDRNRVQMTMELVDGRWLASKVELL